MFGKACDFNELRQGKYEVAVVNRKSQSQCGWSSSQTSY